MEESIRELIVRIVGGQSVADIGKVVKVDEVNERCDVEIMGKAPAKDARLSINGKEKEKGWVKIPMVGSDVVVVWVNGVMPVVVAMSAVEKILWNGVDVFTRLNEFMKAFNEHTHSVDVSAVTYISPAGTPTPVDGPASANAPSSSVEEFEL